MPEAFPHSICSIGVTGPSACGSILTPTVRLSEKRRGVLPQRRQSDSIHRQRSRRAAFLPSTDYRCGHIPSRRPLSASASLSHERPHCGSSFRPGWGSACHSTGCCTHRPQRTSGRSSCICGGGCPRQALASSPDKRKKRDHRKWNAPPTSASLSSHHDRG